MQFLLTSRLKFNSKSNFLGVKLTLNMLGMYLSTLIIGRKSCNMLSILNNLKKKLRKEMQNVGTNNVFLDKK